MGTHFRLIIIVKDRKICMWGQYDGYPDEAGKNICNTLKRLINEIGLYNLFILLSYSTPVYIDADDYGKDGDGLLIEPYLKSPENDALFTLIYSDRERENDEYHWHLDSRYLYDTIKSGKYIYNDCNDVEYSYTINFPEESISMRTYHYKQDLSFDEILEGMRFVDTEIIDRDEESLES